MTSARNTAQRHARKANRQARSAAQNPALKLLTRWGYVVRGVLYGVMGLLALGLALGRAGHGADQRGALAVLVGSPFSRLVLVLLAAGLVAYALWGFVRAVYDPLHRGKDLPGLAARLGFAWSGFAYAALLLVILQLLFGATDPQTLHADSVQTTVARALAAPMGVFVTAIAGVIGIVAGLGQFVDAWRAPFMRDLKQAEMSGAEEDWARWLGRYGLIARGTIFVATGWFILQAAVHHNATMAHGFGAAFDQIQREPFGNVVVAVLGLGFIALALHSLAYARWVRTLHG
jgi:hypothetical protein